MTYQFWGTMKVCHVATYPSGGAGIAAIRWHEALRAHTSFHSHLLTLGQARQPIEGHTVYEHHPALWDRLINRVNRGVLTRQRQEKETLPRAYDWFSHPRSAFRLERAEAFREADVIHLHWVADFAHLPTLFPALRGKRVCWTPHDLNPGTGGCHYTVGCRQFEQGCERCPQLAHTGEPERVVSYYADKLQAYGHLKPTLVCPSTWIAGEMSRARLTGGWPQVVLPNVIPPNPFSLAGGHDGGGDNSWERSSEVVTVLFVADSLANQRKGFGQLLVAIERLSVEAPGRFRFVGVGAHSEQTLLGRQLDQVTFLGPMAEASRMAELYRQADLFVLPSLEDNLPNTVAEALCCGCPVVAHRVGGVIDMVVEGENGLLTPSPDAIGLTYTLLKATERTWERRAIAEQASRRHDPARLAKELVKVYETLRPL